MPTTVEEPIKDANPIKDATMPTLGKVGNLNQEDEETIKTANGGILKECSHGYEGGKGCYLCDPDHPYRKNGGAS